MKIKLLYLFLIGFILSSVSSQAKAAIIHLDGIAHAGWYDDDLTKAHLYIADADNPGTYYYQWHYGSSTLPWSSREELATYLNNGGQINGNPVGNYQIESGGDVFNNPANVIWKMLNVSPGIYKLKLTADSRAYQLNEFLWGEQSSSSPPVWNAYVQMYVKYDDTTSESFNFGQWSQARGSEGDVLALYHSIMDGMTLNLTKSGTMYFYINDYNSVDNGAGVTLEFASAPLPGSLLLFGSGFVTFLAWRWGTD